MFIGDFEKSASWSYKAVKGCKRFLDRVWNLSETQTSSVSDGLNNMANDSQANDEISNAHEISVHRAIKKVGSDIENIKFNTAIATLMALVNEFYAVPPSRGDMKVLLSLLSPFAPHITEELWELQGFNGFASNQAWPEYDENKTLESEVEIAVQILGKLRRTVKAPLDADEETLISAAVNNEKIARLIAGKSIIRTIVVKNKLVNLIVK